VKKYNFNLRGICCLLKPTINCLLTSLQFSGHTDILSREDACLSSYLLSCLTCFTCDDVNIASVSDGQTSESRVWCKLYGAYVFGANYMVHMCLVQIMRCIYMYLVQIIKLIFHFFTITSKASFKRNFFKSFAKYVLKGSEKLIYHKNWYNHSYLIRIISQATANFNIIRN